MILLTVTNYTFKYSIDSGFSYINSNITINNDLTTIYYLSSSTNLNTSDITNSTTYTELGIKIKFTDISDISVGDYWEFDCAPTYTSSLDEFAELIPPKSINFLGEFGFMLEDIDIKDYGFEVMFKDQFSNLTSEKFSYFYQNINDSFWKLTNNLHINGSLQLEVKDEPSTQIQDQGQLIYRNDKKVHFINENGFDSVLDNDMASQFDISLWNVTNDGKVHTYSQVVVGDTTIEDGILFKVNGSMNITGNFDASSSDLVASNIDASGSISVGGFKSTNLNTQNLTVEDRNYQVGFADVILIDKVDRETQIISSRISHGLTTGDYVYFQETNVYFT